MLLWAQFFGGLRSFGILLLVVERIKMESNLCQWIVLSDPIKSKKQNY